MAEKLTTTSRLDSLSRRASGNSGSKPGAKAGLKFKPKVVARRSKEERDADAPSNANEAKKNSQQNRGSSRGRGKVRGRGGRSLAGTHLVQAGPLASGTVFNDAEFSMTTGHRAGATPEYMRSIVDGGSGDTEDDSDSEDDGGNITKINMSKNYRCSAEESELFPVRAPKFQHTANDHGSHRTRSFTPESSTTETSSDLQMSDVSTIGVKREGSADLNSLIKQKDVDLQNKLSSLKIKKERLGDVENADQELLDHRTIIKKLSQIDNKDDQYLFFQLPRKLPEFQERIEGLTSKVPALVKGEETGNLTNEKPKLEGTIGKIRVHKSGKVTMKIGNVILDVGRGSQTQFLQDVVLMKDGEEHKTAHLLGHLQDKIVAIPRFV